MASQFDFGAEIQSRIMKRKIGDTEDQTSFCEGWESAINDELEDDADDMPLDLGELLNLDQNELA